jgi:hypothetical protein
MEVHSGVVANTKQLTIRVNESALKQLDAYARKLAVRGVTGGAAAAARMIIYEKLEAEGLPVSIELEDTEADEPKPSKPRKR